MFGTLEFLLEGRNLGIIGSTLQAGHAALQEFVPLLGHCRSFPCGLPAQCVKAFAALGVTSLS